MQLFIDSFFNIEVLKATWPFLWRGFLMTLQLCAVVVPLGVLAGATLAVLYSFRQRWLNWFLVVYIDFFRSFPPLVLLIFLYYGLPMMGLDVPSFAAVVLAFTLNTSSYFGEIFRAGIESIPKGQYEAARSTGLGRLQSMVYIILPQATRNVAPDLISNTLEVVKATSLASVVALPELLRMARVAQGTIYNPTPLIAAALIYLVMLWPVVRLLSRMERRMLASR